MTSIDFQSMLREERKKALQQLRSEKKTSSVLFDSRKKKIDLKEYKLKSNFGTIYYIPNYITEEEETKLVDAIYNDDKDTTNNTSFYKEKKEWVCLSKRRLKNLGGIPHPSGMYEEQLPKYITDFRQVLKDCGHGIEKFLTIEEMSDCKQHGHTLDYNQVLLNEYQCGKGIRPHKDGPLYLNAALVLSLKTTSLIDFYIEKPLNEQQEESVVASVFLEPRSLLVFCGDAYTDYYHGVRDVREDVIDGYKCLNLDQVTVSHGQVVPRGETRLSLTIRCVRTVVEEKNYTKNEAEEVERRRKWWELAIDN